MPRALTSPSGIGASAKGASAALVTAEKRELVRSPQPAKVATGPRGRDQRDIDHTERGGVLQQQAQCVGHIEYALASVITERTVLLVAEVTDPRRRESP